MNFGNISGNMNVFARVVKIGKDKAVFFTTSVSSKDQNDKWQSAYMDVKFSKAAKEMLKLMKPHNTKKSSMYKINVTDGWLIPIIKKEGFNQIGVFVNRLSEYEDDDDSPFD